MTSRSFGCLLVFLPLVLTAQSPQERAIPLNNWTAPRQVHRSQLPGQQRVATPKLQLPGGVTTDVLVFVPIAPCRLADTRSGAGHPALGSTPLAPLTPRTLPIAGSCGVSSQSLFAGPEAYSLSVTVVPPSGTAGGYLLVYPNPATPIPLVASMTWNPGASYQSNAVITAASPGGSVNVVANATTDVVIDINGYYAPPSDSNGDTALGASALDSDTSGTNNTAFGLLALAQNTSGASNTAIGSAALATNTGGLENTAIGASALQNASGPVGSTAVGFQAMSNSSSILNIAIGSSAMQNATGDYNIAIGSSTMQNASGDYNIGIGNEAGNDAVTGCCNIMIGNLGTSSDDHTIRIGDVQTSAYIAGISGVGVSGGAAVVVNSNGQLGVETSSLRYKENIEDMGDASEGLLGLRPVTFHYKKPDADGSKPLEYGLIAEEVAHVYPELVVRGADGQIESVQYQKLPAMLLNELQKEHHHIQQQDETIEKLEARLAALEAQLVSARANGAGGKVDPPSARAR
jgi:hypothetical protein